MDKTNFNSIKRENIKKVFRAISDSGKPVSRSGISEAIGLSLMTVGKVVDTLAEWEIVKQQKETKSAAGRKAGMICVNDEKYMLIVDISSVSFSLSAISVGMVTLDKMCYSYNREFFFEENLHLFLKNVRLFKEKRFGADDCIGVGVALPGVYDPASDEVLNSRLYNLCGLKIKSIIGEALGVKVRVLEEDTKISALAYIREIEGADDGLFVYMSISEPVVGAVISDGRILYGDKCCAGAFGRMICRGEISLDRVIAKHFSEGDFRSRGEADEDFARILAETIYNISVVIDPRAVIIEPGKYKINESFIDSVNQHFDTLNTNVPLVRTKLYIRNEDFKQSHTVLANELRLKWLDERIGGE